MLSKTPHFASTTNNTITMFMSKNQLQFCQLIISSAALHFDGGGGWDDGVERIGEIELYFKLNLLNMMIMGRVINTL